ncbi:hypothetical protein D3C76_353410 [compost metagenome]
MKKRLLCTILLCLALFIGGCSEHYKADYIKKFDSYLKYSLGDFEVIDSETIEWRGDPLPTKGTGKWWAIAFTDDLGIEREFEFRNFGYSRGGDSSNFGFAVMEYAIGLCKEQIIADVLLQHFEPDQIGYQENSTNDPKTSVSLLQEYPSNDNYAKFVDKKKGIQLKSIQPKELINDWGVSYRFNFETLIDDEEQTKEFIVKVEQVLRDYAKYVDNYDLLPVEIDGENYEDGYYGTYNKETDAFTWITKKEYLESLKYIDGNLKEVDTVIINGKEYQVRETYKDEKIYTFANSVTYCQETKQYHIKDFEDLLTLLGYKVSDSADYAAPIRWKVDTNTYTVSKAGDWYLLKNGGSNLLKYDGHECGGISQSDFEMISNTTVYMDKEKGALVVESN